MPAFDAALDQFKTEGSFIYQSGILDLDNVKALKESLQNFDPTLTYKLHLIDVCLMLEGHQDALVAVVEQPPIYSTVRARAARLERADEEEKEGKLKCSKDDFLKELLGLFSPKFISNSESNPKSKLAWSSIKIEGVYFQENGRNDKDYLKVCEDFHFKLLRKLNGHKSLIELSLNPFYLNSGWKSLYPFLDKNTSLEELYLGITEGHGSDWRALGLILSTLSRLKQVSFENTVLNKSNHSGLTTLLEHNYQTKIILPSKDKLSQDVVPYEEQTALETRLKKTSGEQRFIDERLSEKGLLDLALQTLDDIKLVQSSDEESALNASVSPKLRMLETSAKVAQKAINISVGLLVNEPHESRKELEKSQMKDSWEKQEERLLELFSYLIGIKKLKTINFSDERGELLPKVYQNNQECLKSNLSLFKLNLKNKHPRENKTIAYILLEKVCEIRSENALKLLLDTNIDIYESPKSVEESLFVKVFKDYDPCLIPLKALLLNHVIASKSSEEKNIESISKISLRSDSKLISLYKSLINLLNLYGQTVLKRQSQDFITKFINNMLIVFYNSLGKENTRVIRAGEFAEIKGNFSHSIKGITNNHTITMPGLRELDEAREYFVNMRNISDKYLKGYFRSSSFHPELKRLTIAIIDEIDTEKKVITDKLFENEKKSRERIAQLEKQHAEELKQVKSEHVKEISTIKEETGLQQTNTQAEQIAMQAKIEELEKKLAEANKVLEQNQEDSENKEQDAERAGTSQSFFTKNR